MSLCSTCQTIDLLDVPRLPSSCSGYPAKNKSLTLVSVRKRRKQAVAAQRDDEPLGQPYHQSLEALQNAATDCAICKVVAQDISRFQDELAETEKDKWRSTTGPDWKMWLAKGANDVSGFMVVSADSGNSAFVWILSAVGLCVDDQAHLSHVIAGRRIDTNPASETTVQRALSWIQQDDTEHAATSGTSANCALPPRVLDVSSSSANRVSLYTSHGRKGKYAALSYASNATISATTNDDVESSVLPKVFQDAITMTSKLGLRYLWIDALCIPQDNPLDSYRTSSQLASVYSNAYITLAATGSTSDTNGMLTARSPNTYEVFEYTRNTTIGNIYAFSLPKEPSLYPSNDRIMRDEPLSQHGWALQERLFSPRILHFGSTQMYFECNTHFIGEDGFKMSGRHDTLTQDPSRTWQNIVSLYCRRSLPKPSDKLPALSNLARHIAEQTGDTYIAGLWRSKLIEGLVWQAIGHAAGRTSEPPEYRAPSWSWASIDGPFGKFNLGSGPDVGGFEDVVEILDCLVTLKDDNLYGEVTNAWIKMRAPLEALSPVEDAPRKQLWKMKTKNGDEGGTMCIFDTLARAERAKTSSLYVIPLTKGGGCQGGSCAGSEMPCYHSIVVAAVSGKEGTYERMGKVVLDDEILGECEWMQDKGKLIDITLV